jgi:hypothetical protein
MIHSRYCRGLWVEQCLHSRHMPSTYAKGQFYVTFTNIFRIIHVSYFLRQIYLLDATNTLVITRDDLHLWRLCQLKYPLCTCYTSTCFHSTVLAEIMICNSRIQNQKQNNLAKRLINNHHSLSKAHSELLKVRGDRWGVLSFQIPSLLRPTGLDGSEIRPAISPSTCARSSSRLRLIIV